MMNVNSIQTLLFVPEDHPDRFAKAMYSGADAVILDLEDTVDPNAKICARGRLRVGFEDFQSLYGSTLLVVSAGAKFGGMDTFNADNRNDNPRLCGSLKEISLCQN